MNMRFLGLAIVEAVRQRAWTLVINTAGRDQRLRAAMVYRLAADWTDAQYATGTVPPTGWAVAHA
jgi:hypothetical protein